jgi:formate C-acetyltransferase
MDLTLQQSTLPRFEVTGRIRSMLEASARRYATRPPLMHAEHRSHAFFELFRDLPMRARQARSLAYAMVNEPVHVFAEERVHGIFYTGWSNWSVPGDSPWASYSPGPRAVERTFSEVGEFGEICGLHLDAEQRTEIADAGASPAHVAWNYHWILERGAEDLVCEYRDALRSAADGTAREFYEGVLIMLDAMLEWNRRHVCALERLLSTTEDRELRQRLSESIEVMRRVPAQSARTFREAIQSFYFTWLAVIYENPHGGNSPGRLDYFLWPYLRREWEAGLISYQESAELIAELFIKIDERVHPSAGTVHTIVVGGMGPDGSDAVNPLSTMMLDVFEQLNITHPAVYSRISRVNPPAYLDRCVDYLLNGGNRAQIVSDEAIVAAMTRDGRMPREDAAMYMCGGCMEINPHGMNSDLLFSFTYNVPKTLELLLTGGRDLLTGCERMTMPLCLADCAEFETFYRAFIGEMRRVLHAKFRNLDIWSEEMARHRPTYLLSSMITGCLERGREQQDGGALYSDYGGTPLGLQNAADSLTAIRLAVFEQRLCTAGELVAALDADFDGHELLRAQLLRLPKYGQGDPDADAMMNRLLRDTCEIFDSYRNRHGRYVKPIIFTFVWAPRVGGSLGASPDGRRARAPIGHGLTPQATGMTDGLTTALQSCTALDQCCVSGGASTMWDMDHRWITFDTMKAVLTAFLDAGGMIFQGNTTDVEELRRAVENPQDYAHLIVRVGGFSAHFTSLATELQQEIIGRHRHAG